MGQKSFIFGLFMGVLFIFSGCAAPKFDASNASLRSALLRGEIKEAFTYYETEAQEAEKNAAWGEAVNDYLQAADAARFAGQLQRAITYGEKALEITHGTNAPVFGRANLRTLQPPPLPEIEAIQSLIQSFASVRDFDKVRLLAENGLRLFRENPSGERIHRMEVESQLYEVLGRDILRQGDYQKAIKTFEQVVILRRAHFANRSKLRMSPRLADNSE